MKRIVPILSLIVILSFSVAAQMHIVLPESLRSSAVRYGVTKPNKEFLFDGFKIVNRTMAKERISAVTTEVTQGNPMISDVTDRRTRRNYIITSESSNGLSIISNIERLFVETEAQLNSTTEFKIGNINLTPTSSTLTNIDADVLEVYMQVIDTDENWKLMVVQEIASGALNYSGSLSDGTTNIKIVPEFGLNKEEPTKWDRIPVNKFLLKGFVFYLEEKPVAALQVAPSFVGVQVWLMPDLEEKLRFILSAAMPCLYFEFRERI